MRKKYGIYLLLVLFLGLIFVPPIFADTQGELKKIDDTTKSQAPVSDVKPPEINRIKVEYKAMDLRDPFREGNISGPGGIVGTSGPDGKPQAIPKLSMQGIVWGTDKPRAIINDRVVKTGDLVEGGRVINIDKEGVTLLFGSYQYLISSPSANMVEAVVKDKGVIDAKSP